MRDTVIVLGSSSTLRARLYLKIDKRAGRSKCWRWNGKTTISRGGARRPAMWAGYDAGVINVARILLALADRVPLSERRELHAGHVCGNYWCVNVRHLRWQTASENERMKREHRDRSEFFEAVDDLASEPETGEP